VIRLPRRPDFAFLSLQGVFSREELERPKLMSAPGGSCALLIVDSLQREDEIANFVLDAFW